MPLDLEARSRRTLEEIITLSNAIRCSALRRTNLENFEVCEKLRHQLETIRISADTILESITKASLTHWSVDDRVTDWLLSGEPRLCTEKLKEMDNILKLLNGPELPAVPARLPARPFGRTNDQLAAAITFFDKHNSLFHFLVTADVWNRQRSVSGATTSQSATLPDQEAPTCHAQEPQSGRSVGTGPGMCRQIGLHRQKLDEISRWLAAVDPNEKHNYTLQLRREGTCMWFPKTHAYETWRSGRIQLLWLQGKAGCGKSVLAASTVEHLKSTLGNDEVIAFFYCDFQNKRSTSCAEVMRSLLAQLLRHMSDRGINPGDLPNKILGAKCEGTLLLDDPDRLCDEVSRAAILFPCEPIIVIDALDECTDVEALLRALLILNRGDARLLVTSRPNSIISHCLSDLPSLSFEIAANELAEDMALHVRQEVDSNNKLRSIDAEIKEEIRQKLNERAEGRFRWVQCQLDSLKKCGSRQELREALDNLPTELEASYERILDAIDERSVAGKLARRALVWLVAVLEPLRLVQLVDGLSIDFSLTRTLSRTQGWPGVEILDALSSLVSYHEETDVVTLSHFSVKEFLLDRTALPTYQIIPHEAHAEAAQTCIRYLSTFIKEGPYRGTIVPFGTWPMLSYVFSSGFNHLAYVDPGSSAVLEALQCLGSDVRYLPTHWDLVCELREEVLPRCFPPWPTSRHDFLLYILVAYSSVKFLRTFLSENHPLKARIRTNPLVYAADFGKTEHAVALLEYDADVNRRGLVVDDTYMASPLEVAIDLGQDVLVSELLQKGSMVTAELLTTAICMPWCPTRVLVLLMQTDAFVKWVEDIGDEKLCRYVFSSARPSTGDSKQTDEDHVAIATRLYDVGIDVSPDSPLGIELVERAMHAAHTLTLEHLLPPDEPPASRFLLAASTGDTSDTVSVVNFLLRRGVDINVVSEEHRDTALHLAVMCSWEPRSLELTKVLMGAGCQPHICNARGETPVTMAITQGYLTVVEQLLSTDTPLPSYLLQVTLERKSHPRMVELLVRTASAGASSKIYDLDCDKFLKLAMDNYDESACMDIVEMFLKAGYNLGYDPVAMDNSALVSALEREQTSLVELLLSFNTQAPPNILFHVLHRRSPPQLIESLIGAGADVNVIDLFTQETVLHAAIYNYEELTCMDLVKRFIDLGVAPHACNSAGISPLEAAIKRRYVSVAEFLLSSNARVPPGILIFALRCRPPPQLIDSLIGTGADVNLIDFFTQETVLHAAIYNYEELACLDLVGRFIDLGVTPHACNSVGTTPLQAAIERRHVSVAELLLSFNVQVPPGILIFALRCRSALRLIESLIGTGADVNVIDLFTQETVLHVAIYNYEELTCLDLVKRFINLGVTPHACNSVGTSPLRAAIERRHISVVEFLLSFDTWVPPDILLHPLLRRSPPHLIESLICAGADVNLIDFFTRETVLYTTICDYEESTCLYLVERFVDLGVIPHAYDSVGTSPLEAAIERGYTSVIELLLSRNFPCYPPVLLFALRKGSPPNIIQLLAYHCMREHSATMSEVDWDAGIQLYLASYTPPDRLQIIEMLHAARQANVMRHPWMNPMDETPSHVTKRPRLE